MTQRKNRKHAKKLQCSTGVPHPGPRSLFLPRYKFIHSTKHVIDHFQGPMDVQFHKSCFKLKALLKPIMWPEPEQVSSNGISCEIYKCDYYNSRNVEI